MRRGYDRDQVDSRVNELVGDRNKALSRITALEQRIQELLAETEDPQAQGSGAEPSYAVLGPRIEKILRLAEEEAEELGRAAREAADHEYERAVAAADRLRADADTFAADVIAENDRQSMQMVENAQARAAELRTEANKHAAAVREEADAFFE
ncbi:cellulose-binding protein, partial [Streptomyces sp. NPDC056086]